MRVLAVGVCSIALLLGACAQIGPYRDKLVVCELDALDAKTAATNGVGIEHEKCPGAVRIQVRGKHSYDLAYVEIDDQGFLANRAQAESAIKMAGEPSASGGRIRVVAFVHGWHHNAEADDDNVVIFQKMLAALSEWYPQDTIRGIYIGWRGKSLMLPFLQYLSFWDRKNTSDEVGRGSLYEVLMRLEHSVKSGPAGAKNRLVLVGHSFGASVTFNSLAQRYMQRFMDGVYASGPGRRFRGYGDMVVLVNPAIEAMRYMPFQSALGYYTTGGKAPIKADFSNEVSPVLLILSSEGDWATRKTFPAGRFFSTFNEAHQAASMMGSGMNEGPYSQWSMDTKALGNYQGFNTHEVIRLSSAARANQVEKCPDLPPGALEKMLRESANSAQTFPDSGVVLKRKTEIAQEMPRNSPYWHADIGTEIIKDHTQINSLNLVCWVSQLIDAR